MPTVSVRVDEYVEVDVEAVLEDLDAADLDKLREAALARERASNAQPLNDIIERAYLRARTLPDLPREFRDLLWHVHGRAI